MLLEHIKVGNIQTTHSYKQTIVFNIHPISLSKEMISTNKILKGELADHSKCTIIETYGHKAGSAL